MAATTFSHEYTYTIPPARLFKASVLDSHNLFPKLLPQAFKSTEILQGNGGAGSIKQINLGDGKIYYINARYLFCSQFLLST